MQYGKQRMVNSTKRIIKEWLKLFVSILTGMAIAAIVTWLTVLIGKIENEIVRFSLVAIIAAAILSAVIAVIKHDMKESIDDIFNR